MALPDVSTLPVLTRPPQVRTMQDSTDLRIDLELLTTQIKAHVDAALIFGDEPLPLVYMVGDVDVDTKIAAAFDSQSPLRHALDTWLAHYGYAATVSGTRCHDPGYKVSIDYAGLPSAARQAALFAPFQPPPPLVVDKETLDVVEAMEYALKLFKDKLTRR